MIPVINNKMMGIFMALRPCKECGNEISDKAVSCPHCGAAQPKKTSLFVKIIAWFFGLGILFAVLGGIFGEDKNTNNNNSQVNTVVSENQTAASETQKENTQPENWLYDTSKDELHGTTTKVAVNLSLNQAQFDFPYSGGSNLVLTVRKNHAGSDVYISITKGQFVCGVVDGCEVAFKFDDGKIMSVTMVEPDSHASDVLFVGLDSTEEKIINKLKTSKKLIIAPKFYEYGDVQFTFDVSNYKPI